MSLLTPVSWTARALRPYATSILLLAVGWCLVGCRDAKTADVAETVGPADAVASLAPTTGETLLRGITEAERTRVFSGYKTAVYGADERGRRTRMHVARLADGRMVLEWEQGGETARRWVVRHRHRWIDEPSLLLENYDVVLSDEAEDDVAWRPVTRVELRPRRAGRPSMTLLVDAETQLVLGERLRGHDGVQRFSWRFDTIDYEPPTLDVDEAEIVAAPDRIDASPDDCAWSVLTASKTPAGFRRVGCQRGDDDSLVEYWSDGLAAFVLRQRPATELSDARDGELERRECSGRASVTGTVAGVDVTLLGNVPVDELEAVAASLRVRP